MGKNTIHQLKETIIFKGDHVLSELRSLSFEPSVSITEHADQVVVEGTLHLAGEGSYDQGTEQLRASEQPEVQEAIVMEELIYFEHHFPLSISISAARVERKQDVEVYIDHVDYDIPESGRLAVTADIMIEGITEPKPEKEEVRVLPNPLENWEGEVLEEHEESDEGIILEQEVDQADEAEAIAEESLEAEEFLPEELIESEVEESIAEERVEEDTESNQDNSGDTFTRFIRSLEEEKTVIKIHIAQQDETPETVAERYGIPMLQLMKVNQFESRRPFNRGELIRIPETQIHSK
ncbi:hypothetical protein JMA_23570 [Jeotgalibacillus malaysiensis]|uniref:LysM domain-containing protein n=1 Tax=Jeotgalibacillus malaysiensis TaxID=1508404 RepID=A0A0B5AUG1_9BACL|nr:hypothetical protein [Jeotgalibacillus malaysiensis]AJD91674.1 hypothetical protein JMA_23570 [Jeotgalibacillus malaysiensis]